MGILIRPMREDDVEAVERLSDDAFHREDLRTRPRSAPEPARRTPGHSREWIARTTRIVRTDPAGCWVADADGAILGVATSMRRDTTWILATLAVDPGHQGRGLGHALLDAALTHARHCTRGMLAASDSTAALRRYRAAGFHLHPQMVLIGPVDRADLPRGGRVRDGVPADVDLLDSIDRRVRDAAHGTDHLSLLETRRLRVIDGPGAQGYVYHDANGSPALLAATSKTVARSLLWAALAEAPPAATTAISHVTAANEWALDIGIAAGLTVHHAGYLALRGMRPPQPYLHHGALL